MSNKYCKHKQMIGQMARVDTLVQDWSSVDCVFCKEEKVEVSVPKQYCPHQEYISLLFHKDIPYEYDCPWCNPLTTQRPPSEEKDWLEEAILKGKREYSRSNNVNESECEFEARAIRSHIREHGPQLYHYGKEEDIRHSDGRIWQHDEWLKFLGIRKDGGK